MRGVPVAEYEWDVRCADLELARLERGYTSEDFLGFAGALLRNFEAVRAAVHVETGRLQQSGAVSVDEASGDRWSGEISFGGGGVKWAASEFFGYSDKHGGYPSHVYFRSAGWQPFERAFHPHDPGPHGPTGSDVRLSQGPISNTPTSTPGIEDDMLRPAVDFFARGQHTPHPEGPAR
jgi:hypothetical protein